MTGDYAVVVDGHCHIPDRNYLRNLVRSVRGERGRLPRPAAAAGRPGPDPVPGGRRRRPASRLGHNPDSDIYSDRPKFVAPQSTAVAYRREVFHRVGLFDERFDACEDVEFNHRVHEAGLTCYFTPAVKVVYHPRPSWTALFIQLARYGCGRARLAAKHPRSLTPAGRGAAAVAGVAGRSGRSLAAVRADLRVGVPGIGAAVRGGASWPGRRGWAAAGRGACRATSRSVFVGIHARVRLGLPPRDDEASREAVRPAIMPAMTPVTPSPT